MSFEIFLPDGPMFNENKIVKNQKFYLFYFFFFEKIMVCRYGGWVLGTKIYFTVSEKTMSTGGQQTTGARTVTVALLLSSTKPG